MICRTLASREGFSLAETALSIAILAVVVGALVPGLLAFRTSSQAIITQSRLEGVMRAASAYVHAYGCLPCPTPTSAQATAGRGVVRGDTSASPAVCGSCTTQIGLVPYRSLGMSESAARDGYTRWITYGVDSTLAQNFGTGVLPNTPCQTGDDKGNNPPCSTQDVSEGTRWKKGICLSGLSAANRILVYTASGSSQQVAIIAVSHGPNGRGAFTENGAVNPHNSFPTAQPACTLGVAGFERCNGAGVLTFATTTPRGGADPFDDQMLYYDRNAFIASQGGLSCATTW